MNDAKPGDLIIVFYEKLDGVLEVIRRKLNSGSQGKITIRESKVMQGA